MAQVPLLSPRVQYFDANGDPLASGKIYTYEAGTSTPKATYTDAAGGTPNANPVILDSAGRATIWGTGAYKIVVKDSADATLYTDDNYTAFSATSNSAFSDSTFAIQDNSDATKQLQFECSSITTGSTTVITVPNGNATMATVAGTQTLTNKTLTSPTINTPIYPAEATLASATTTDLATANSNIVSITGTTTITSFGSSATTTNPLYFIRFTGALTLTHNATSLISPTGANITTVAGDCAIVKYEGSGNWRVVNYQGGSSSVTQIGSPLTPTGTTTASFTSIPATYKNLILKFEDVSFTGTVLFTLEWSVGGSFTATGENSLWKKIANTTVTTGLGNNLFYTGTSITSAQETHGFIRVYNYASSTQYKYFEVCEGAIDGTAANSTLAWGFLHNNGGGVEVNVSGVIDGIRMVGTSNFDAGTLTLYGEN